MNELADKKVLGERKRIMEKYNCGNHQVSDYQTKEENEEKGNKLCIRCNGTGNELFSMYRKCEACSGTGIFNYRYDYDFELSHTQKRILMTLQRKWRFHNGGNSWKSFKKLAKYINRPLRDTRRAVHDMKDKGIVKYGMAVDGDMRPHGSGYFLTTKYDRL